MTKKWYLLKKTHNDENTGVCTGKGKDNAFDCAQLKNQTDCENATDYCKWEKVKVWGTYWCDKNTGCVGWDKEYVSCYDANNSYSYNTYDEPSATTWCDENCEDGQSCDSMCTDCAECPQYVTQDGTCCYSEKLSPDQICCGGDDECASSCTAQGTC
tara:strand:+ start:921 stop:1391 length:471 start_codon:yes stop_codon:yes gene_type:complete